MITPHQCAHLADDCKKLGGETLYHFDGNAYGTASGPYPWLQTGATIPHSWGYRLYYEGYTGHPIAIYPVFFGCDPYPKNMYGRLRIVSPSLDIQYASGDGVHYNAFLTGLCITPQQWVNLFVRVTAAQDLYVYVGNSVIGPYALTYTPTYQGNDVVLMRLMGYSYYTNGYLKDVVFYNRDVGDDGANMFQNGGVPAHPQLYLPGTEGDGDFKNLARSRDSITLTDGVWQYTDPDDGRVWI